MIKYMYGIITYHDVSGYRAAAAAAAQVQGRQANYYWSPKFVSECLCAKLRQFARHHDSHFLTHLIFHITTPQWLPQVKACSRLHSPRARSPSRLNIRRGSDPNPPSHRNIWSLRFWQIDHTQASLCRSPGHFWLLRLPYEPLHVPPLRFFGSYYTQTPPARPAPANRMVVNTISQTRKHFWRW